MLKLWIKTKNADIPYVFAEKLKDPKILISIIAFFRFWNFN
jgi:hypothetical protein